MNVNQQQPIETDGKVQLVKFNLKPKLGKNRGNKGKNNKKRNKGNKDKKGSRKPRLRDRLNTKENREKAREIGEEVKDYIDDLQDDLILEEKLKEMNPEKLNSELIKSVKQSDLNKVIEYLNKGADINTKDKHGQTPLHIASKRGYSDIAKFLLDNGADIRAQENKLGQQPLHLAAAKGHLDIVKSLVEKGADVDYYQGGGGYSTPLHFAAKKGHFFIVKYLIENGADPDKKDGDGKTPMERAAEKGITDIAEYLKVRMRHVTEVPQTKEEQQITTEMENVTTQIAEKQQVTTEIQNITTQISHNPEKQEFREGELCVNEDDITCIYVAVRMGILDAVKYFVEKGIDVNVKFLEDTPLHFACRYDKLEIVKYLIEKGANIHIDGRFGTPLHAAAADASLEIVQYLIEKGADVNASTKNLDTPLHFVAFYSKFDRKVDIAEYLLFKGANLCVKNIAGNTPLHMAALQTHFDLIKYFVDRDIGCLDIQNNNGETALHIVACKSDLQIVELLVEKSTNIDLQDVDGNTPLHIAFKCRKTKVTGILIKNGANLTIKDKNGKTPTQLSYYGRYRRDTLNSSWINSSTDNLGKDSISLTKSVDLLTSRQHDNYTITEMPEINTAAVNNTIILGILAASLFNKTHYKQPIHENLLSPKEHLIRNIANSSRILEQSLQKAKEERWDILNKDVDNKEFSGGNKID